MAFISSVDGEGYPNTKVMLPPREREGLRVFYFTTNASSVRVAQYRNSLYFCDKRFFRGVMLREEVEVLEDRATKECIWRDGDTLYYAGGVNDPDYCVLKFTGCSGRYYSNFHSEDFQIQ